MMQWRGLTGVGEESGYGDFIAPTRKLAVNRANATPERLGEEGSTANATRYLYRTIMTGIDEAFDWEQWVTPRNIGEILLFAIGGDTPSTLAAGEYSHLFEIADALPSFTLTVDRKVGTSSSFQIAGCKINTLSFENVARGVLGATIEGVGQRHRHDTALTLLDADKEEWVKKPFIFQQLAVMKGINGVTPARDLEVKRVSLSIVNNLVTDKVTADGSYYIHELPEGKLQVTGAFDRQFEDLDDYNAFIGDQDLDLNFSWTGPMIDGGSNEYSLTLDCPNCTITSQPLPEVAGGNDEQVYTVEFVAKYDITDTKVISAILVNDIASY